MNSNDDFKNEEIEVLNQNDIEAPDKDSVKLVETKEIDGSFVQKYKLLEAHQANKTLL